MLAKNQTSALGKMRKISYPNAGQSWGILGITILSMLLFAVISIPVKNAFGKEVYFLVSYILSMGVSLGIVHFIRYRKTSINNYNFSLSSLKITVLASFSLISIQVGIISPIVDLIPMSEAMQKIFLEVANQKGIFTFITIVIAAPILEELIFRGIILNGLLQRYSPIKSIVLSSILFGIVHLNPWQFINAFIIGLLSGWVFYKTKKLTLSIFVHFVNNLLAFVGMYFTDAEIMMNESLTEFYGGFTNMILIIMGAITASIICVFLLRKEFNSLKIDKWHDENIRL